ncbi:MAG: hypothetical protein JWQ23_114 [Herminiimonas sp.]|nr:hypothetical protein [Herminiimonas sp.]
MPVTWAANRDAVFTSIDRSAASLRQTPFIYKVCARYTVPVCREYIILRAAAGISANPDAAT